MVITVFRFSAQAGECGTCTGKGVPIGHGKRRLSWHVFAISASFLALNWIVTGGDALFDHLADALPWNGHGTPGGLSVKVSLLLDSRLPSTIDNTIRWRTRILDFRQGGKVGSRTYFLTLPLQHVCFSMNTGDRITVWGARVGPHMKCTIDVSAESGGAAKHADYGKPGISVDLFAGLGGWSFGHQLATTFGQPSFPPVLIAVEIDRSVAELSGVNLRMKTIDATDFVRDS